MNLPTSEAMAKYIENNAEEIAKNMEQHNAIFRKTMEEQQLIEKSKRNAFIEQNRGNIYG